MRRSLVLIALVFIVAVAGLFLGFRDLRNVSERQRAQVESSRETANAPETASAPAPAAPARDRPAASGSAAPPPEPAGQGPARTTAEPGQTASPPRAQTSAAPAPGTAEPAAPAAPEGQQTARRRAPEAIVAEPRAGAGPEAAGPSFDVVRVEPSGETVVAGRAAPGSRVVLYDRGERLGGAVADRQGQWVIVLDRPLGAGGHELSIEARRDDGSVFVSPNVVIVSVPEPAPVQTAVAPATQEGASAVSGKPTVEGRATRQSTAAPPLPASDEAMRVEAALPLAVLVPREGAGPAEILQHPEPPRGGMRADALRLETVNYDEQGAAVIGGRAPAGAIVILYLDGEVLARTRSDQGGRWSARLDRTIGRGVHELRVDQVDESGRVVAQVRSPFARAEIVAGLPDETAVVVQPGNSLWRIARRIYGEGVRYTVIYDANKGAIGDPDLIYPGQIFTVPRTN